MQGTQVQSLVEELRFPRAAEQLSPGATPRKADTTQRKILSVSTMTPNKYMLRSFLK